VLEGVGPVRAAAFERLGIRCLRDLLLCPPARIEVRGDRVRVADARESVGRELSVVGTVSRPSFFRRGGRRSVVRLTLTDATGAIGALWFNQPWLRDNLRELAEGGEEVELYGRIVTTKSGPALSTPRIGTRARPLPPPGSLRPVYPLGEGLGQELVRRLVREVTKRFAHLLEEPLPAALLEEHGLPPLAEAVARVHRPEGADGIDEARRRLALESLLALQAGLRGARVGEGVGRARPVRFGAKRRRALLGELPFRPTRGQERVLDEVLRDLARTRPMRRLLQGEVGSGKTLVATAAAFAVAASGGQSAILVPTELLAEQHHLGLEPLFERLGVRCRLHVGSQRAPERRAVRDEMESGGAQVVVGTHALLSPAVRFHRLDLAVIDEQQRFGVAQKQALLEKGRDVHVLLMTATPIPRTLALTLYGDLETSLLAEKPPGRGPVQTRIVTPAKRGAALRLVRERLEAGERVFWVCPRIEAADDGEAPAAVEEAHAGLAASSLGEFGVRLVHGRLSAEERARRIRAFRAGEAGILVGTTIVEVGVDVPEATVMVIDGAERLGLAQLHQLRGRIGRGPRPSWCLLLAGKKAGERMRMLESTDDGFAIAEEDLRQRGMGELAGLRQAGGGPEGLLDASSFEELALLARRIVLQDPSLLQRYADAGASPAAVV